ncbi:MAG: C-GCAxxG-C-C family (seleno)protein [Bacteroidales bacterium]|nr:C-GCAxxG-C-C family (seleno)protein [Bacteroidales bacterium]
MFLISGIFTFQSFRSGLNCAQAVITAYADKLNFDYKQALCLSCGFGGGIFWMQFPSQMN